MRPLARAPRIPVGISDIGHAQRGPSGTAVPPARPAPPPEPPRPTAVRRDCRRPSGPGRSKVPHRNRRVGCRCLDGGSPSGPAVGPVARHRVPDHRSPPPSSRRPSRTARARRRRVGNLAADSESLSPACSGLRNSCSYPVKVGAARGLQPVTGVPSSTPHDDCRAQEGEDGGFRVQGFRLSSSPPSRPGCKIFQRSEAFRTANGQVRAGNRVHEGRLTLLPASVVRSASGCPVRSFRGSDGACRDAGEGPRIGRKTRAAVPEMAVNVRVTSIHAQGVASVRTTEFTERCPHHGR